MAKQWLRKIRLVVGEEANQDKAIDFSGMHIRFHITQKMTTIDTTATIYVINPKPEIAKKYRDSSYGQRILLQAGYEDNCDTIFKGTVRQVIYGRENETTTFMCFLAGGMDIAKNYTFVNKSLAKGSNQIEQRNALMEEFRKNGAENGYMDDPEQFNMPRGKVYFGMGNDYMRDYGKTNNLDIAYNNDQVFMTSKFPETDTARAFEINVNTGMIGLPQLSANGIMVTCLLNPKITTGKTLIKLTNSSIQMPLFDLAYGAEADNLWNSKAMISADGLYQVISTEHSGDTRGNEWYTTIMAKGINSTVTPVTGPAITGVSS